MIFSITGEIVQEMRQKRGKSHFWPMFYPLNPKVDSVLKSKHSKYIVKYLQLLLLPDLCVPETRLFRLVSQAIC